MAILVNRNRNKILRRSVVAWRAVRSVKVNFPENIIVLLSQYKFSYFTVLSLVKKILYSKYSVLVIHF